MRLAAAELWCSLSSVHLRIMHTECQLCDDQFLQIPLQQEAFLAEFFLLFWSNTIMNETIQLNTQMRKATISI